MNLMEVQRAYERYLEIISLLKKYNDKKGLRLLDELIDKCLNYFEYVVNMESKLELIRFRKEPSEYQEKAMEMDKRRRILHNVLISQLRILNRYLFKIYKDEIPVGGIYSLDVDSLKRGDRIIIGDWSMYLIKALYMAGILKK